MLITPTQYHVRTHMLKDLTLNEHGWPWTIFFFKSILNVDHTYQVSCPYIYAKGFDLERPRMTLNQFLQKKSVLNVDHTYPVSCLSAYLCWRIWPWTTTDDLKPILKNTTILNVDHTYPVSCPYTYAEGFDLGPITPLPPLVTPSFPNPTLTFPIPPNPEVWWSYVSYASYVFYKRRSILVAGTK